MSIFGFTFLMAHGYSPNGNELKNIHLYKPLQHVRRVNQIFQ
jgi:hypothetical protein